MQGRSPSFPAATCGRSPLTSTHRWGRTPLRSYDHHDVSEWAAHATPRQRRLLGDLGYDFRPGSYFYVPLDQAQVIYGDR